MYTQITHQSWGNSIQESFKTALIGFIIFAASFPTLFLNEGRAVHLSQKLEEGESIVISIDANRIDVINDGQLVHLSAKATTDETLSDSTFAMLVEQAIKLRRIVEMYQWNESESSETEELVGGGTETRTTYTYTEIWSDILIDSDYFKLPKEHVNPPRMPIIGEAFNAKMVTLGNFTLSDSLIANLNNYDWLPLTTKTFEMLPETLRNQHNSHATSGKRIQLYGNYYYIGQNPVNPQIGELRIKFEAILPTTISVVAKQSGSELIPYTTKVGGDIELFEYGAVTAEKMFKRAKQFNNLLTWALRFIGFSMMFFGLMMIFNLLRTQAALLPFIASIVEFISVIVAFIISLTLSIMTISFAWIYHRPLVGILLLVLAVSILFFLKYTVNSEETESTILPEEVVPEKTEGKIVLS
ncbi:MAG: TMEM43 family protein [Candidatus Parabeggiatoa sp.]|nr:TMEM43 family protein [Candidatus Parabeggiatoa sp.]